MARKKFEIVRKGESGKCKFNFVNSKNEILSKEWFDHVCRFDGDLAGVMKKNEWNFINTKGEIMLRTWYDHVYELNDGLAIIGRFDSNMRIFKMLIEVETDKPLGEGGGVYSHIEPSDLSGKRRFIRVCKDGRGWNFIDRTTGRHLSGRWFNGASPFFEGMACVTINKKSHFINEEGTLVTSEQDGFDDANGFYGGFAEVCKDVLWNMMRKDGSLLLDKWYQKVENHFGISNVCSVMNEEGRWAFVNRGGNIVSDWFDDIDSGNGWIFANREDGLANVVDADGNIVCEQWFDYDEYEVYSVSETITAKCEDGITRLISREGGHYTVTVAEG